MRSRLEKHWRASLALGGVDLAKIDEVNARQALEREQERQLEALGELTEAEEEELLSNFIAQAREDYFKQNHLGDE